MWKIINLPKKAQICVYDEDGNMIREDNVKYLTDYTPEPLTADGLTLREFANKANSECTNVERVDKEPILFDNLLSLIYCIATHQVKLSNYRIKPEVVHYTYENIVNFCGKTIENGCHLSSEKSQVTCPDCIAAMTPKYVPWTFESAPDFFIDNKGMCHYKGSDGKIWGFIVGHPFKHESFDEVMKKYSMKDGSPCGMRV